MLHEDGSASIVEPDYDSETFMGKVQMQQLQDVGKHRNERP
jgi:hypothetical protein